MKSRQKLLEALGIMRGVLVWVYNVGVKRKVQYIIFVVAPSSQTGLSHMKCMGYSRELHFATTKPRFF
jgi:hypothetical protein